jgi:cytochrome c oxidase subunit 3
VSVTLVFMAVLMGMVAFWLLRQTINIRPWAAEARGDLINPNVQLPATKIGLGVFMAVVASLFSLFISAYSIRMTLADWRPMPEPDLLWVNTGILVLASIALQWAWNAANKGKVDIVKRAMSAAGALTVAFVLGQYLAWEQLMATGYFMTSNPANAFFFLLTGLHALHLFGGLVAWYKTSARLWRGVGDAAEMAKVRLNVELCAVYWHFLLVIWLILFGLMLNT